jgi:hypothetical protein
VLGLVAGNGYPLFRNVKADLEWKPNLDRMMFLHYARLNSRHLLILLKGKVGRGRDGNDDADRRSIAEGRLPDE